jgi:hypothetical protein
MFAMVWCDDFNFVYYVILLFIYDIVYGICLWCSRIQLIKLFYIY